MDPSFFEWLETSSIAVYIRRSALAFPIIEIFHIIGFIFLTGAAFLFDLRLLGVSRQVKVSALAMQLLPWSRAGLILAVPSGLLLFISQATALSANPVFGTKLVLISVALVNAMIFHRYTFRTVAAWNDARHAPATARAAAIISISVWIGVISCGRLIAYF